MKKALLKHKVLFVFSILFIFILSGFAVAEAFLFKLVIDTAIGETNYSLKIIGLVFSMYMVLKMSLFYINRLVRNKYIILTVESLKQDVYEKIMKQPLSSMDNVNTGRYVSIFNNDLKIIEERFFNSLVGVITMLFSMVWATIALIYLSPIIAMSAIIISVVVFLIPRMLNKKISSTVKSYLDSLSFFTLKTKDIIGGIEVIKAFGVKEEMKREFTNANKSISKANLNRMRILAIGDVMGVTLAFVVYMVPFFIGAYLLTIGNITVGTLIAASSLLGKFSSPLGQGIESFNQFKTVAAVFDNLKILDEEKTYCEGSQNYINFENKIKLDNVTFGYNDETEVLKNLSLEFNRGSKYIITGASGSGKSTILQLLQRKYHNYLGKISYDNQDLQDLNSESLLKHISVVRQDVFLFDDTLRNNLTLYKEYGEEEILAALGKVGLLEKVNSLEKGLDSFVGESGKLLSGGEKQRLSIARTLLNDCSILLLDEATSSLDSHIAKEIEEMVLNLKDVTVISISHRLTSEVISKYDEVILIEEGNVKAHGNYITMKDNEYIKAAIAS